MDKREITLAEGLKELKIIRSKLDRRYREIAKYSSKMAGTPDIIEKQADYVREKRQSAEDLLRDWNSLKMAIQKANIEASFEFKGETYTLAEAIFWKQTLKEYYENLWRSFTPYTAEMQIQDYKRGKASMTEEELVTLNKVPHLFYDEREIEGKQEDLLELVQYIDALIDKTNHQTMITY